MTSVQTATHKAGLPTFICRLRYQGGSVIGVILLDMKSSIKRNLRLILKDLPHRAVFKQRKKSSPSRKRLDI